MCELEYALSVGWADDAMSNAVEGKCDLDPWDPDSDDDGLTDGQEHNWLTHVPVDTVRPVTHSVTHDRTLDLDPAKNDTDGDGYWDGWIGVHGVGYSDDVILYREHLQSGDGIEGEERVDEQVGIHEVDDDDPGAYLYGNDTKYHSNIHIGELHWKQFDPSQTADPTIDSIAPDPQLTVEVDYHSSVANTELVDESLETAEETYQLYGINIDYVKDQIITQADLRTPGPGLAGDNEDLNHDIAGSAYMFITYDGDGSGNLIGEFDWTSDPNGVASCQGADFRCDQWSLDKLNFGTVVLHKDIASGSSPYRTHAAKTIVHETGHLIGAGRNDDGSIAGIIPEEVYSGRWNDETKERVKLATITARWSVMSSGWKPHVNNNPMNGKYIAFSIEELLTVEFNNVDSRD